MTEAQKTAAAKLAEKIDRELRVFEQVSAAVDKRGLDQTTEQTLHTKLGIYRSVRNSGMRYLKTADIADKAGVAKSLSGDIGAADGLAS